MASEDMLQTYDERVVRANTQKMTFASLKGVPCVLRVQHRVKTKLHTHHVLVGLHRGIVLFDDDCDRARVKFRPKGTNVSFWVTRGASVYENLPGFVPVACTCIDWLVRGTSSVGNKKALLSVNDSGLPGKAGSMGAVRGCKHMIAANQYLNGGEGACAYFNVNQ